MKIEKLEYFTAGIANKNGSVRWTYHPNNDDIVNKINEIIDKLNEKDDDKSVEHGKWTYEKHWWNSFPKCNLCGEMQVSESNYCPNCGAKMREEVKK